MTARTFAVLAACLLATAACQSTTVRGPEDKAITATTPTSLTLRRGESTALEVGIDRQNFTGPVTVSVSQLPRGVEVDRATQKVETDSATFALKAAKDADLVDEQKLGVMVQGMDGRRAMQYVALTVKN